MSRKNSMWPVLLGIAAVGAYRFYKGKGGFNRIRFKAQHNAVCDYLETHYPESFYSHITETEEGWSCVVTHPGGRVVLYMTKAPDGNFIFWEKEM